MNTLNSCSYQGEKALCLKFTAEQLGLVGIKSPLVEYARNQLMAQPELACINPSARIDKGESVCVSSFTYWRHDVARNGMILAASSANVLSGGVASEVIASPK